jgi:Hint module
MVSFTKPVLVLAISTLLFASTGAHFEPNGAVPAPGSPTATGDPNANVGQPGPEPGSSAAAAAGGNGGGSSAPSSSGTGGNGGGAGGGGSSSPSTTGSRGGSGAGGGNSSSPASPTVTPAPVGNSTGVPSASGGPMSSSDPNSSADPSSSAEASAESSPDTPSGGKTGKKNNSNDGSACFPASATVQVKDGSIVRMDALKIGDLVKVSPTDFSAVFMFTHKIAEGLNPFVSITTASGTSVTLSAGHFIYANSALVPASSVAVGDSLETLTSFADRVVSVSQVQQVGLYNPQTVHGDVIVDGVRSSTYTTAVEPSVAHAILAPFRSAYSYFGMHTSSLDSGSETLAGIAPARSSVY